jgi:hypothetical protein
VLLTSAEEDGTAGHAIGSFVRAYDKVIWLSVRAPPAEYRLLPYSADGCEDRRNAFHVPPVECDPRECSHVGWACPKARTAQG